MCTLNDWLWSMKAPRSVGGTRGRAAAVGGCTDGLTGGSAPASLSPFHAASRAAAQPPLPSLTCRHVDEHALLDLPHRLVQLLEVVGDVQGLQGGRGGGAQGVRRAADRPGPCSREQTLGLPPGPSSPMPHQTDRQVQPPSTCTHLHAAVCRHDLVLHVRVPQAQPCEVVQQVLVHHNKLAWRQAGEDRAGSERRRARRKGG